MDNTIKYFKEISKIPRPSGKEEKIKNYLVNFAKKNNLEYFTDNTHNVIIKKNSNKGSDKTLILQAHTDMVCEKFSRVQFDFDKQGINLLENDEFLYANGTTLGADDGIGVSMILSVLSDPNLQIPNIEAVFTTQEETTMAGALALDFNQLKGEHLLSLDGTDEGKIEVSSAGMVTIKLSKDCQEELTDSKTAYTLSLFGLQGGHSGAEIHRNLLNGIKLLFEFLNKYKEDINIVSITGGGKANAIARECSCTILLNKLNAVAFEKSFKEFCDGYKYLENEIDCKFLPNTRFGNKMLTQEETKNIISFVCSHKDGVLIYSEKDKNFPTTSNNFANICLCEGKLEIIISLRSSVKTQEKEETEKLFNLATSHNLKNEVLSTAPFFERKENSYLQKICINNYKKLFNEEAILEDVHAGLEGGVFAAKRPNIDICVIAPNLYNIHTPTERVSKKSIEKTYAWLESIIESF
ncbi:MAG: beta-Ala-His dipeptidase [Clostridia bacterium]|nr:beta-Ala-His dipeptidase [Clostridia bacterium]